MDWHWWLVVGFSLYDLLLNCYRKRQMKAWEGRGGKGAHLHSPVFLCIAPGPNLSGISSIPTSRVAELSPGPRVRCSAWCPQPGVLPAVRYCSQLQAHSITPLSPRVRCDTAWWGTWLRRSTGGYADRAGPDGLYRPQAGTMSTAGARGTAGVLCRSSELLAIAHLTISYSCSNTNSDS